MPLQSSAQEIIAVMDPASLDGMDGKLLPLMPFPKETMPTSKEEISVSEEDNQHPHFSNHSNHSNHHNNHGYPHLEVSEPASIEILIEELPGAPNGTLDPQPSIEVMEEDHDSKDSKDENDAKSKKNDKWDWASKGSKGFVAWIKDRISDIPKHSGYDSAGLERAVSYLDRLDNEISKAMRLDLDGELDADQVEEVRSKIDDGIARLHDRLDKVKKHKKSKRTKKSGELESTFFIKEAQKITGVQGTFVMVPLLISRIGRIIINGTISAGHDPSDMFEKLAKKYKLSDREKEEVMQYLADSGFTIRQDRGYMIDEEYDLSSSDNFDFMANYRS